MTSWSIAKLFPHVVVSATVRGLLHVASGEKSLTYLAVSVLVGQAPALLGLLSLWLNGHRIEAAVDDDVGAGEEAAGVVRSH